MNSAPTDTEEGTGGHGVRIALLLLFGSTLLVGFSGTLARLSEVGPLGTAFWRMGLAVPVIFVWMAVEPGRTAGRRRPIGRLDYILLAAGGVLFGFEIGIWHWSLQFTSVANATFLSNSAPIVVTLGGWLVFGTRVTGRFLVGMALSLAGGAVLMGESLSIGLTNLAGDAIAVVAAILFGAYILVIARLRADFATSTIMAWTCVVGAAVLLPAALLTEATLFPASLAGWAIVIASAVACQGLGQSLLTFSLAHLPTAFSSVGYLVVPVMAALAAWAVLGEPVSPVQGLGAAIVVTGVILARRGSR